MLEGGGGGKRAEGRNLRPGSIDEFTVLKLLVDISRRGRILDSNGRSHLLYFLHTPFSELQMNGNRCCPVDKERCSGGG